MRKGIKERKKSRDKTSARNRINGLWRPLKIANYWYLLSINVIDPLKQINNL